MSTIYKTGAAIFFLAAVFLAGVMAHRSWSRQNMHQQADTVYVWKTVEIHDFPTPVESTPAPDSIPPVTLPIDDLTPSEDSSFVSVRPEVRTWRDTLPTGIRYEIQTVGVGTSLQHVGIAWPERHVTDTKVVHTPPRGWGLYAVGGSSFSGFKPAGISPFLGLELEYTKGIVSFGISPGVQWDRPPGSLTHSPSFRIDGTLKIRICKF